MLLISIKVIYDRSLTALLSSGEDFLLFRNSAIESGYFDGFLFQDEFIAISGS
jgi:hypothetical protein